MDYLYPQSHIDENLVQDILISSLEKFLCVDEDPEKIFKVNTVNIIILILSEINYRKF